MHILDACTGLEQAVHTEWMCVYMRTLCLCTCLLTAACALYTQLYVLEADVCAQPRVGMCVRACVCVCLCLYACVCICVSLRVRVMMTMMLRAAVPHWNRQRMGTHPCSLSQGKRHARQGNLQHLPCVRAVSRVYRPSVQARNQHVYWISWAPHCAGRSRTSCC